jgi:hypothetical protein
MVIKIMMIIMMTIIMRMITMMMMIMTNDNDNDSDDDDNDDGDDNNIIRIRSQQKVTNYHLCRNRSNTYIYYLKYFSLHKLGPS